MSNIKLDITKAACFLEAGAVKAFEPKVKAAQQALEEGTCPGNDFLGWLHLPSSITPAFLDELQQQGISYTITGRHPIETAPINDFWIRKNTTE